MKTKTFKRIIEKFNIVNYDDKTRYEFYLNEPIELIIKFNNKVSITSSKSFVVSYEQLKDAAAKFNDIDDFRNYIHKRINIKISYFAKDEVITTKSNKQLIAKDSGQIINIIKIYKYEKDKFK